MILARCSRFTSSTIAARLGQEFPQTNQGLGIDVVALQQSIVGDVRPTLLIFLGAVSLVLLIACANVANLLLVRAASRQKEIALRTALGASRFCIARQMITESVLLALIGGALGVVLSVWGIDILVKLSEGSIPPTAHVRIDVTVLSFTFLLSLLTGLLFGLVPALRTLKLSLGESLKEGGRAGEGIRRNRTRSLLVVLESAVAIVLLIGAGLLIRSLIQLQSVNPGFDAHNVLTMRVDLPRQKYPTPDKAVNFFQQLESRIGGLPGVEAVGFITELPLSGQPNDMPFNVEGRAQDSDDSTFDFDFRRVNDKYFRVMRIPLLRGRNFTETEVAESSKLLIVSELLAKEVFPNKDPIGKRLVMWMNKEPFEIIGVVGDVRHRGMEFPAAPAMYFPTHENGGTNLVVRTQGEPLSLATAVRKEVQGIDPDQPVAAVRTMEDWLDSSVATPRYRTALLVVFALVALLLASTGIYGVMSYSVTQRTHEIGVRMALGARQFDVLRLVVRQGMSLVLIGVGLGIFGAIALTRVMSTLLFGVTAKDPATFVAVATLLALVAFVACYIPARRATKVDPLVALRYE